MKLLEQIAQSIVDKTTSVLELPMSITNEKGIIIGCTDQNRLGSFHGGIKEVLNAGKAVEYTEEQVANHPNILPGVATPIFYEQKAIGVLGIVGNSKDIIKYVYLIRTHVEMLLHETLKMEAFSAQLKTTENFIRFLLQQHHHPTNEQLIHYCEMMDFDLETSRRCILIQIQDCTELDLNNQGHSMLQVDFFHLIKKLFKVHAEDIVTSIRLKQWLIFKVAKDKHSTMLETCEKAVRTVNQFLYDHQLKGKAVIAAGNSYKGVDGVSRSYKQALKLLTVGKRFSMDQEVYSYQNWEVLTNSIVHEIQQPFLESMVEYIDHFINHPQADILTSTFFTYCREGLNISKAARQLYVHRNTLIYRLNQIEKLLSINVHSFEQCMFLYIALKGCNLIQHNDSNC
ncbi:carbohydrate diacid regulator [Oikeobacillus pervagus]|uniref:Carbohydrate diacid regulator n=1 Tax=Oikeobacillus pervagus TaxID=1325931 RepID=A0AAJ1T1C1_9BACI|nr:sugar diacid recognition domain-containing protein [Oikeobacillus pervagus]MDQ0214149.1 carbohydrate diacid regulator [Oikeobacillus pervagus]